MNQKLSVFWYRRDLRLEDNTALFHALKSGDPVLLFFIFDKNILNDLEEKNDARVSFIHKSLCKINEKIKSLNASIVCSYDHPLTAWKELLENHNVTSVFYNRDYEPYAAARDTEINSFLESKEIQVYTYKDHVIHESHEVLKNDGTPYTVFTPYSKKWKSHLSENAFKKFDSFSALEVLYPTGIFSLISLAELGFTRSEIQVEDFNYGLKDIQQYKEVRNIPALNATSKASTHLRFGTISIRSCFRLAEQGNETWMNELIWREFFIMIMANFPQVVSKAFRPAYDRIKWINNEEHFDKWCKGLTGFPLVDAGMRELVQTGFMHNRVRMVTASFLVKDLLIDWRWGEAFFAKHLLDFDLAVNNGNWQWAAGCGTDAAPYFRIFNPESQQKKFDPDLEYIKKWIPEYRTNKYPSEIIDHSEARLNCLRIYKIALAER